MYLFILIYLMVLIRTGFSKNEAPCTATELDKYYFAGSILSILGSFSVMISYLRNPSLRKHPAIIVFCRSFWDFLFSLNFVVRFIAQVEHPGELSCGISCVRMAIWLTLTGTASAGYFGCAVYDLYISINNPFTKPAAYMNLYHVGVLTYALFTIGVLGGSGALGWRNDIELCLLKVQDSTVNPSALIFFYLPIGLMAAFAIYVSVTARNRLSRGLPDTFAVKGKALADGLFYIITFSIYAIVLAFLYSIVWLLHQIDGYGKRTEHASIVFALFLSCWGLVDFFQWFARNWFYSLTQRTGWLSRRSIDTYQSSMIESKRLSVENMEAVGIQTPLSTEPVTASHMKKKKGSWSRQPPNPGELHKSKAKAKTSAMTGLSWKPSQDDDHTINKALRREVLAFTTDGIAQSVDRAKLLATKTGVSQNIIPGEDLYPLTLNDPSTLAVSRFGLRIKHNHELLFGSAARKSTVEVNKDTNELVPSSKSEKQAQAEREFTDYAPLVFRYLRKRLLGLNDEDYVASIIPSSVTQQKDVLDAKFGEGRSGAMFYRTHDSRFLVKTITQSECRFFISILKKYVEYLQDNPDSALNLFVGLHSCRMYNLTLYFVVVENIFLANLKPHEVYDLKGSWVSRHTHAGINSGEVMKDMDLNRYVILSKQIREKILNQIESDTMFLRDLGVMDYSLLLGVYYMQIVHSQPRDLHGFLPSPTQPQREDEKKEPEKLLTNFHGGVRGQIIEGPGIYYLGIIDILQEWNWSKKMEYYFKTLILRKPGPGISCVEPAHYQQRFSDYMNEIIITDENFLELNSINTSMFHSQTVLQYPASEVVNNTFRKERAATVVSTHAIEGSEERPETHEVAIRTAAESVVPSASLTNEAALSQALRGTYYLHRGSEDLTTPSRLPMPISQVNDSLIVNDDAKSLKPVELESVEN